ncbi:hypothetical protein [Enterococcus sp. AZ163]|uniref:hypothetical protein n=1 Tax=Enterococcus sp. AZ163 TaxID=2774638 RepID=UPI003D28641F
MNASWTSDNYQKLIEWQNTLNNFPPRLTGSKGHQQFISWLKNEINDLGFSPVSETHYFNYWEPEKYNVYVAGESIEVSGYFPYSGLTPEAGITKDIVFLDRTFTQDISDKIVVFDISMRKDGKIELLDRVISHPLIASRMALSLIKKAKEKGAAGVIFVWDEVSSELTENEVLPFTNAYLDIPAVWISAANKQVLKKLTKKEPVTLCLTGTYALDSPTETFYVTIPGTSSEKKESILITTHTDGPNAIEENGPIALLSMLSFFKKNGIELPQTLVFSFVSGHFQQDQIGGPKNKATGRWLDKFPELWDGKEGHLKAIFSLTLEHLGCLASYDNSKNEYIQTDSPETNYLYTSNQHQQVIVSEILKKSQTKDIIQFLDANETPYFGEGMPIFKRNIPNVSMITMPEFLFQVHREYIKPEMELMYEQIQYSTEIILTVSKHGGAVT